MNELVRAEVLKLTTIPMTRWLFAAAIAMSVVMSSGLVLTANPLDTVRLDDPDLLARAIGIGGGAEVVMIVFGILVLSQEFRFGTATATFLTTPNRVEVLVAKAVAVCFAGACIGLGTAAVTSATSALVIRLRGGTPEWTTEVGLVVVGTVAVMALYGLLGLAVAMLIRNHIVAIFASLAWLFIVEQQVMTALPSIGRWTTAGATASAERIGRLVTTNGTLLPAWAGALLLLGYASVLFALGVRTVSHRDITGPS